VADPRASLCRKHAPVAPSFEIIMRESRAAKQHVAIAIAADRLRPVPVII
jgi:hypothetical protein